MKKFITLLLVFTGMVSTASADVYIKGTFNGWGTANQLTGTQLRCAIEIDSDSEFKLYDSSADAWYGYSQMNFVVADNVLSEGGGGNVALDVSTLGSGTYVFSATYTGDTKPWTLTLTKGTLSSYSVDFVNGNKYSTVNIYTYGGAESCGAWDGTAMTKKGTKSINGESIDILTYSFNAYYAPEKVIFNDGGSWQTANLDFVDSKVYAYSYLTVAGDASNVFTEGWDIITSTCFMKSNGDGTYTYSVNNVALTEGDIEYKVVKREGSVTTWEEGSNKKLVIPADGVYNISVTSNADMSSVSATVTRVTATATVGGKGYATYCNSDYALDFTGKSIQPYVISSTDGSALTLTNKKKIAKNEPVLLYSSTNNDSQSIPAIADGDATAEPTNKLVKGTGAAVTWTDDDKFYVLMTSGEPGFYKADHNPVAETKAYLDLSGLSGGAHSFTLDLDEGNTTGIANISSEKEAMNGAFYNLAGQKVAQPTKGLYIMNGKKVIIK